MKIAHIDEQTGWRGGEQQASWLMQGLAERGHTVYAVARPGSRFIEDRHGGHPVVPFALPLRGELDIPSAWRLGRWLRRNGIDIVHAHSSHAHSLAVLGRYFAGQGRVVVSRRVSFAPKPHPLNRWKYGAPDMTIAVSHEVARVLHAFGLPEDRLTVVHSVVDLARLDVAPLPRAELGVPESAPLVVSAGALVGHKDHLNLVEAMAKVVARLPEARLRIAGEGPLRGRVEERIRALGLEHAIGLLGHREDAPRLIRAGDVYVSSSWSEGLGTSILEALACETPVVAAQAGGAAEMVKPGETGYLVPSRDPEALAGAILASLENRDEARRMARNGRSLIERDFVKERMVEGVLAVYQALLER